MSTKPKLKLIPLPKELPRLPEESVYLGTGSKKLENVFLIHQEERRYFCSDESDTWDQGFWEGGSLEGHYAAPRDSVIAREILGVKESPKKAKKATVLRKLPKNVPQTLPPAPDGHKWEYSGKNSKGTIEVSCALLEMAGVRRWEILKNYSHSNTHYCIPVPLKKPRVQRSKRIGVMTTTSTKKDQAAAAWIKRLKKENGKSVVDEAIKRAGSPVKIIHSDETGEWLWAVTTEDSFWMDVFKTKQEAEDFITVMAWPMIDGVMKQLADLDPVLSEFGKNALKFGEAFARSAERDGTNLPDWLPALPPVPAGYDRWEPTDRSRVSPKELRQFGYANPGYQGWYLKESKDGTADFYIEAVRDEHKASVMDDASTHIELHQKEIDRMDRKITADPATWSHTLMESLKPQSKQDNSAVGLLTEAAETIGARAAERDVESERSMVRCVAAFNVMFGKDITEEQGWLFMVLLKMSRSTVGHRRDDFSDGASYFGLAGECALNQTKP